MTDADAVAAPLPGIHHVTAITSDGQRNVDFYAGVLGLRLVKQTVNFDVPDTYHLYYGDRLGTPGTAITFFVWPHLDHGAQGSGQVAVTSFAVPGDSLDFWANHLADNGVDATRQDRFDEAILGFGDADGMALELVASASDAPWSPWEEGPIPLPHAIRGFHSVTLCEAGSGPTIRLLEERMGLSRTAREGNRHRFELGEGGPGAIVEVLDDVETPKGEEATGTVHHVAYRTRNDGQQLAWRKRLIAAGLEVTPVIDRSYFHSIYFREPGGVLFEIATDPPGFTVDETSDELGSGLMLPEHLEGRRDSLSLSPLARPRRA